MVWLIYAISAAAIWGLDYSLGEKIFEYKISPYSLLSIQLLCGALLFIAISFRTHLATDLPVILHNKTLLWIIIAAIFTFNCGNLLIFLSIQAKNATIAGLIELSYPIFTIFFTWLLFRVSHFNLSTIIGGLMIMAGIMIISLYAK